MTSHASDTTLYSASVERYARHIRNALLVQIGAHADSTSITVQLNSFILIPA